MYNLYTISVYAINIKNKSVLRAINQSVQIQNKILKIYFRLHEMLEISFLSEIKSSFFSLN